MFTPRINATEIICYINCKLSDLADLLYMTKLKIHNGFVFYIEDKSFNLSLKTQ